MSRSPRSPRRLERRYGAGPWHLAGHLSALAVAAFAAFAVERNAGPRGLAEAGALLLGLVAAHDLVLLPACTALDRLTRALLARLPSRRPPGVPVINHLRAPALISGLLLLLYAPLISGRADRAHRALSGHPAVGYLRDWLLISGALLLGSALLYALRVGRAGARR